MRRHYDLWQGSGLSQAQYCRENHINAVALGL
ncbi:MAG: IS66 family insertion sequence element accessory protein TnpA [Mangrovibacterium sp.]